MGYDEDAAYDELLRLRGALVVARDTLAVVAQPAPDRLTEHQLRAAFAAQSRSVQQALRTVEAVLKAS